MEDACSALVLDAHLVMASGVVLQGPLLGVKVEAAGLPPAACLQADQPQHRWIYPENTRIPQIKVILITLNHLKL